MIKSCANVTKNVESKTFCLRFLRVKWFRYIQNKEYRNFCVPLLPNNRKYTIKP